jgi:MFS family permease
MSAQSNKKRVEVHETRRRLLHPREEQAPSKKKPTEQLNAGLIEKYHLLPTYNTLLTRTAPSHRRDSTAGGFLPRPSPSTTSFLYISAMVSRGGIGLGIGYISPVSTLLKWFPDRPGMAIGMAIMGFGGGAMLGSPLAVALMNNFQSLTSTGVWETFATMGTICFCIIMSMYGGGFATIPAYLRDIFGTMQVGAIHGRLLTAWSTATELGPVLVNYIREYQITAGVPRAEAYSITTYIMVGLLLVGFISNRLMVEGDKRHYFQGAH